MSTGDNISDVPSLRRENSKRKRDNGDTGRRYGHQRHKSMPTVPPQSHSDMSHSGVINYLPRNNARRLSLLPGDADTFSDVIGLIGDFEGVIDQQDSLAASMGARLTGPRLLKGIERFFDGPIRTNAPNAFSDTITWLDVVAHAKGRPHEFVLTTLSDGARCCQFQCKGWQVEITEDDWRLISSGALDRFPLEHPFEEDETAELATLDILEQRATVLYNKADEVAARARILHHKLGSRRQDISRRRLSHELPTNKFQPLNQTNRQNASGSAYDLHSDLLQQFLASSSMLTDSRSTSGAGVSVVSTGGGQSSPTAATHQHRLSNQSVRSNGQTQADSSGQADVSVDAFRAVMTQKVEKLLRGDTITPPCDRCRRLRLPCVKHLTACQGCTKKHAKCTWRSVTEDEATRLRYEMGIPSDGDYIMSASTEGDIGSGSQFARVVEEGRSSAMTVDVESRPQSRAGWPASGMLSPKTLPSSSERVEVEVDGQRRLSVVTHGTGQAAPGGAMGNAPAEFPREPSRLSQIANMASTPPVSSADPGSAFGGILNPSSR